MDVQLWMDPGQLFSSSPNQEGLSLVARLLDSSTCPGDLRREQELWSGSCCSQLLQAVCSNYEHVWGIVHGSWSQGKTPQHWDTVAELIPWEVSSWPLIFSHHCLVIPGRGRGIKPILSENSLMRKEDLGGNAALDVRVASLQATASQLPHIGWPPQHTLTIGEDHPGLKS